MCRGPRRGCVACGRRDPPFHRPNAGSAPPTSHGLRQRARAARPLLSPCHPSLLALSLCAFSALRLASPRTRFALTIADCSSGKLCACMAAVRCLPRDVPACFCHPAHPDAVTPPPQGEACIARRETLNISLDICCLSFSGQYVNMFLKSSPRNVQHSCTPQATQTPNK